MMSLSCNTAQAKADSSAYTELLSNRHNPDIRGHIMDIRGAHWIIVTVSGRPVSHIMDIRGAHWIIAAVSGRPVSLCELGPFVPASGLTVCCLDQCSQARFCPCNGQSSDRVRDFVLVVCNAGRRFTTVLKKSLSFTCVWKTTRWLNYYWYYFRFSLRLAIIIKDQVNGHEMSDVMVQIINIS